MAFDINTTFTLNAQSFYYLNGNRNQIFVPGNHKEWDGSNWQPTDIMDKEKLKRITFSGTVHTDEEKALLEALRTKTVYTDFDDGILTLSQSVVLDLEIDHDVSGGPDRWVYTVVIEEYDQVA